MATDTTPIAEHGVATLPDQAWERARRRAEIIGPLAQSETVGHEAADAAAQALGLSRRQVYVLIRRARQGSGLVTDLALGQSSGGKGKGRLPEPVERIIRELLQKRFLTKQKRSLAAFYREVAQACKVQKLRVPARNTVALRIAGLDPREAVRRREGKDAARNLQGVGGEPPAVAAPLEEILISSQMGLLEPGGHRRSRRLRHFELDGTLRLSLGDEGTRQNLIPWSTRHSNH